MQHVKERILEHHGNFHRQECVQNGLSNYVLFANFLLLSIIPIIFRCKYHHDDTKYIEWNGRSNQCDCETSAICKKLSKRGWKVYSVGNLPEVRSPDSSSSMKNSEFCSL